MLFEIKIHMHGRILFKSIEDLYCCIRKIHHLYGVPREVGKHFWGAAAVPHSGSVSGDSTEHTSRFPKLVATHPIQTFKRGRRISEKWHCAGAGAIPPGRARAQTLIFSLRRKLPHQLQKPAHVPHPSYPFEA